MSPAKYQLAWWILLIPCRGKVKRGHRPFPWKSPCLAWSALYEIKKSSTQSGTPPNWAANHFRKLFACFGHDRFYECLRNLFAWLGLYRRRSDTFSLGNAGSSAGSDQDLAVGAAWSCPQGKFPNSQILRIWMISALKSPARSKTPINISMSIFIFSMPNLNLWFLMAHLNPLIPRRLSKLGLGWLAMLRYRKKKYTHRMSRRNLCSGKILLCLKHAQQ